jgi:hypothetical protein
LNKTLRLSVKVPLFSLVEARVLKQICAAMEVHQFKDGSRLVEEGDVEIRFHLVQVSN